jgi:hypothetical protein
MVAIVLLNQVALLVAFIIHVLAHASLGWSVQPTAPEPPPYIPGPICHWLPPFLGGGCMSGRDLDILLGISLDA